MFGRELSIKQHIIKVASTCFYQLRRLRQLRCLLGQEVTAQLVSAFIMSRVDYCNSVLVGLPHTTLEPLQRVQNAAARLVLSLNLRDHVKPGLKQLHWLPLEYRIQFKLCLLMHHVHYGTALQYLTDAVQSVTSASSRTGLRSANTAKYVKRCIQGLSLGSGGSASLAQLLGLGYHLTCSTIQTLMVLRKNLRLFCFNLL